MILPIELGLSVSVIIVAGVVVIASWMDAWRGKEIGRDRH